MYLERERERERDARTYTGASLGAGRDFGGGVEAAPFRPPEPDLDARGAIAGL